MIKKMISLFSFTLYIIFCSTIWAANIAQDEYVFNDAQQQQRFYHLLGELRCLVCQNQNLADSQSDVAQDLRQLIYKKISAGETDKAILNYLQERYGDFILYRPPLNARTLLLWIAPLLFLLIGASILLRLIRR